MTGVMPLVQALQGYIRENVVSFHMPGHKKGKGFSQDFLDMLAEMDITEIPGMDNLHGASGVIQEAQQMAAQAFGADRSFFMVNGSTGGIQAMILSACQPGDTLIIPRNSHKSVWSAMVMADVKPVYINPMFDEEHGFATQVSPQQVQKVLEEQPHVKGMILVHPNYYGMCSHAAQIADILHEDGKILLVDEAHGAHFKFHPCLPRSSGDLGADFWVQSAHKTLPAFTQTAYLHGKGSSIDMERTARMLSMVQTTSPSYILMASLDWARGYMEKEGRYRLEQLLKWVQDSRLVLESELGLGTLRDYQRPEIAAVDGTRLVLDFHPWGLSGYAAEKLLREKGVQVEMSDHRHLVLITSAANEEEDFERLLWACRELAAYRSGTSACVEHSHASSEPPKQVLTPREAFCSIIENVPIQQAVGRICGGIVGAYPPGIPRFCPGELLDSAGIEELIEIQEKGGTLFGLVKDTLIPVVRE